MCRYMHTRVYTCAYPCAHMHLHFSVDSSSSGTLVAMRQHAPVSDILGEAEKEAYSTPMTLQQEATELFCWLHQHQGLT